MGESDKVLPLNNMVTIQFKKLNELAKIPTRGSEFAAGYDLYATEDYLLQPMERKLFKTGISIAIPSGLYGRIAPRSGLAFKDGLDVMAGVIDEDYRGDVGVILINLGGKNKEIKAGDKIAQIIFEHYNAAQFQEVVDLPASVRAEGGFGSTDKKTLESNMMFVGGVRDPKPGQDMIERYRSSGGVPVKKPYSEEIKERLQS